jgi:hypothetical protein
MSTQIRKLTQAGANYWNSWTLCELVDAGQEVDYNPNETYDVSCNGEEWCLIDNNIETEESFFEPLTTNEQEQTQ